MLDLDEWVRQGLASPREAIQARAAAALAELQRRHDALPETLPPPPSVPLDTQWVPV